METELDDTSVIESSSYSAPNLLPNINQTADGDVLGGGDDGSAFIPGSSGPSPPPPLLPSVPDYVCCVVTEGVWTWFAAILLIVVLFSAATLKYCKKRLSKPKFNEKNRNLLLQYILEADKGAISKIRHHSIPVSEFPAYNGKRRKHKTIHKLEYSKVIHAATKHSANVARSDSNVKKNQEASAVPFDYNRVILSSSSPSSPSQLKHNNAKASVPSFSSSSSSAPDGRYINASYISNYKNPRAWIVSQGPMENTVNDFWSMVWENRSPAIIMLTKTYEIIKVMCYQYWPLHLNKKETYGQISVTTTREEIYAHYKVRYFTVSKGSDEPSRKLLHYHYLEWPAYANATPNSIIQFWRRLREDLLSIQANIEEEIMDGPPVVHCHEGGVRSGAFLAMDEIFSMAEDTEEVDVFGTLKALLSQRRCLLKSPDNLKYIYDVVEDNILCGQTNIPISEILPILQAKSKKDPVTGVNTYQKEHALLSSLIPRFTIGDCAAGHRAENRQKNRNVLIVPPDSSRPYLTTFQNTDSTDYINAVFVDGYRRQNEFICTEWPMNNTMANFWSMVYDHNIKTIIVLNHHNAKTFQKGSYPAFWPVNGNKKSFGHVFCVEETATKSVEGKFASWKLKLTKQDVAPHKSTSKENQDLNSLSSLLKSMQAPSKAVRLFQIQCWPSSHKVPNSTLALVQLIDEVEKWRGNDDPKNVPQDKVVVVSNDGYSRCGIYCTAAACLDQVYHRQEVDVFQAVKTVRKHRSKLVANPMEYKYCYDVVLHYVVNYCKPTLSK